MERDLYPRVVIQKAAQIGATHSMVHFCIWAADTGYAGRGHVLMLMPTQSAMSDFSQQRFDQVIQASAYLRSRTQAEPPRRKGVTAPV